MEIKTFNKSPNPATRLNGNKNVQQITKPSNRPEWKLKRSTNHQTQHQA